MAGGIPPDSRAGRALAAEARSPLWPLVEEAAETLFTAQDTVSLERALLVTEAYRVHHGSPSPLRRAYAFEHLLDNVSIDPLSNPVFAGNTSERPRAWMLIPEFGFEEDSQVVIEHEELRGLLDSRVPQDLRDYWAGRSLWGGCGIGHLAVDYDAVVRRGLLALISDVESAASTSDEASTYRRAMAICLRALIRWAERNADAAEKAAHAVASREHRDALLRVARACRHVPALPARDLHEGLQAIALVHLGLALEGQGLSISIGLPDRVLEPFAGEAEADPELAADLVAAFLLKIAANSVFGRGSKTQAVTVGGADHTGRDRCNAITVAFLRAYQRVPVSDPPLFLRWHQGLDAEVSALAYGMLAAGRSMPLIVNDDPTVAGLVEMGVFPEDAWDYCVIGCNEIGIPGRLCSSANTLGGGLNFLAALESVLVSLQEPDAVTSGQQLLALLEEHIRLVADASVDNRQALEERLASQAPMPLTSALMRGAAERGCDAITRMPYQLTGWFERGLANAANALAAIEAVVFEQRRIALGDLIEALRAGLEDRALQHALLSAPKWGGDDPRADRWAVELLETRTRALALVSARHGRPPFTPCHVVRSLHHLDGRLIGASADGRLAGAPVGDSIGPVVNTTDGGPTAALSSVLKVDASKHYPGGYNLNITLPAGTTDKEVVCALAEGFLREGGQEIQINVLDPERLRAAQREPHKHRDIVVRVTGLSARFVELSRLEQDELIQRADLATVHAT